MPRTNDQHRTAAEQWRDARSPAEQKRVATETGSKWTPLLDLPYWNSPAMTATDVMHNLYLGVVKRLLDTWKDKGVLTPNKLALMQQRMDKLRPPSDTGRIWRKLKANLSCLTAEELKNLACIYGTYLLHPILKPHEVSLSSAPVLSIWTCFRTCAHILIICLYLRKLCTCVCSWKCGHNYQQQCAFGPPGSSRTYRMRQLTRRMRTFFTSSSRHTGLPR